MNEKNKISYTYLNNGFDRTGIKIPDIPILNLLIENPNGKKIYGPAIIDTGFDGSLFANESLILFLSNIPKEEKKIIGGFGTEEFTCEIFKIKASLIDSTQNIVKPLGNIAVFIPMQLNYLSEYVIIGRELLNIIKICLDGSRTTLIL